MSYSIVSVIYFREALPRSGEIGSYTDSDIWIVFVVLCIIFVLRIVHNVACFSGLSILIIHCPNRINLGKSANMERRKFWFERIIRNNEKKIWNIWKKHKLNSEKIWKIQKKGQLNSEKIWKMRKKSRLNGEMILKIWKKNKLKSEKIRTIWKKSKSKNEKI